MQESWKSSKGSGRLYNCGPPAARSGGSDAIPDVAGHAFRPGCPHISLSTLVPTHNVIIGSMARSLFSTKDGVLGLAPEDVSQGDEVWSLDGCPLHMALRSQGDHLEVIGPCFLDEQHPDGVPSTMPHRNLEQDEVTRIILK